MSDHAMSDHAMSDHAMSDHAMSDHDYAELREIALRVALEAGRLIVDRRPDEIALETKSTATDVVTEMDHLAQDHILTALRSLRPDDGFVGEEEGETQLGRSGITWVVDPIDGTVNYLYRIPAYCVSIAAVTGDPLVEGEWSPVAGAVVNPVSGEAYSAGRGLGAFRSVGGGPEVPLHVSEQGELAQALVATGFGYAADRRAWQAAVLADLLPDIRDIRRMGSAALDLCRVAEGTVDLYYERGLNPWDLAAGWIMVTEAGGTVSGGARPTPGSQMIVAGGNALHDSFVDRLEQAVRAIDVTSA